MGIVLIDGFDLYNGLDAANGGLGCKWTGSSGWMAMVAGRFGGQALGYVANNVTASATRALDVPLGSFGFGFAWKCDGVSSQSNYVYKAFLNLLHSAATASHFMLGVTATNQILIHRGDGVLLGSSAPNVFVVGTWHYLEVSGTIDDLAGAVRIKVDGVTIMDLTGLDTRNGSPTTIDAIRLVPNPGAATPRSQFVFDDLYMVDAFATLGERRVETVRPIADTADKDFVPSTGTDNFAMVDDVTANLADYVQGSVVGDLDLYEFGDLSSSPATIDAVQTSLFALKTDAASRNIAAVIDLSGTRSQGSDHALAATTMKHEEIFPTKPGGASWDASAVALLKAGPKITL